MAWFSMAVLPGSFCRQNY